MSLSRPVEPVPPPPPPASDVTIRDYLEVLRRRKALFIQVFVLVMAVGVVVTLLSKPVYSTQAKLLVRSAGTSINLVDAKNPLSTIMSGYAPDSVSTQLQLLQTSEFMSEAQEKAGVKPRPGIEPPFVRVENLEGTGIIAVTVEGGDPKEIARLANTMLELHQETTDGTAMAGLDKTETLTTEELQKAQARLDKADRELLRFRSQNRVVQATAAQEAQAREYVDLQSRVNETESNLVTVKAQIADLRSRLEKEPVDLVEESTTDNPRVAKLQEKLDDLQLQREDLLRDYKPTSREVRDLDAQIASYTDRLNKEPKERKTRTHHPNPARSVLQTKLTELESNLQGLEAQHAAAKAQFESKQGVVDRLGPWEVQLARLTAERDSALAAVTQLTESQRDLRIRKSARPESGKIVQHAAVPTSPIRPRKTTNLALTFVLALCLAAALAFLQEYLDDRVSSPEDVERVSALPALGHVPLISPGQPRLVSELPANSHVAESYRALRSSIGFAGIDSPIRRLQVTSASKGEGKTITSVNLATAMAMDGKKVILVDADMRRPSIHRVLSVPGSPGLSEVLVGTQPLSAVILPTEQENLYIVPAGAIPPNPAELLGSRRFDEVMRELEEQCDVVVFDTPPCIPVTDPLIIAGRMDGVVLVLHQGQTKKGAVKHVEELLTRARARIIGVIFNRVQQGKGGYYYYHHYYYYGDGYYADTANRGEQQRSGRNGHARAGLGSGNGSRAGREEGLTPRYDPSDEA